MTKTKEIRLLIKALIGEGVDPDDPKIMELRRFLDPADNADNATRKA